MPDDEEPQICDFCNQEFPDYGFDMEWDALLCWTCHLMQNTMMFMMRYKASKWSILNAV